MFDLPQAKRVRRDELDSASDSESDDSSHGSDTAAFLRALNPSVLTSNPEPPFTDLEISNDARSGEVEAADDNIVSDKQDEDGTHAFRLFTNAAQISLSSSQGQHVDAELAKRLRRIHRPDDYWCAQPNESTLEQMRGIALSGEEVKKLAKVRWPGCEMLWRVSAWPASADYGGRHAEVETSKQGRRCRKSKKMRIKLRKRRKEAEERRRTKEEDAKRAVEQAQEKEEYLRTKKAATNRKKQLKKREKERERKRLEGETDADGT